MSKKGPPYCAIGDCQRKAVYMHWLCAKCGRKYGNAAIDPRWIVAPFVLGLRPA